MLSSLPDRLSSGDDGGVRSGPKERGCKSYHLWGIASLLLPHAVALRLLLLQSANATFCRGSTVRPYKRFVMFGMLAAAMFIASAATSEAQGRGRGRTSVVVVRGGFYSPYYDPFFFADPWYGGYQYPIQPYGYG